ncbi:helix-turn-helix domain-containing protein [Paractinoplanes maris]|uniref:helix-turn-helix domain-containing protein n=1 Tax=Paractinoplanes maris TaxID=1734446 RepID=UPI00202264AA|nr:helix-turn-helix transcriptional regulator [Actinoplanes maris]
MTAPTLRPIRITDAAAVGALVADLRSMCLLSQRQLCEEIGGMEQARLSEWETGKAIPTLPYLIPALRALGFDLALIPREDTEPSTPQRKAA